MEKVVPCIICLFLSGFLPLHAQDAFTVNANGTISTKSLAVTGNVAVTGSLTTGTIAATGDLSTTGALSVTQTIQAQAGFGYVPVGTILPWYNVSASAPLPAGWYKCDGQSVAVTAGSEGDLLDGSSNSTFVTPNLNARAQDGLGARGVFLRGGTTAGTVQSDAFQGHRMGISAGQGSHTHTELGPVDGGLTPSTVGDLLPNGGEGLQARNSGVSSLPAMTADSIISDGGNGAPRVTNETRPLNMSVIWIIRVK